MKKSELIEAGVTDPAVLHAMSAVKPEDFPIDPKYGQNRTPEIAAGLMVQEVLKYKPATVVEIGTGSGYVTALLAHALSSRVAIVSAERIHSLAMQASNNLTKARVYGNGRVGTYWSDGMPKIPWLPTEFDVILLTCGAPRQWAESFLAHAPTVIGPIGNTPNDMMLGTLLRTTPPTWLSICAVPGANPLKNGVE